MTCLEILSQGMREHCSMSNQQCGVPGGQELIPRPSQKAHLQRVDPFTSPSKAYAKKAAQALKILFSFCRGEGRCSQKSPEGEQKTPGDFEGGVLHKEKHKNQASRESLGQERAKLQELGKKFQEGEVT